MIFRILVDFQEFPKLILNRNYEEDSATHQQANK